MRSLETGTFSPASCSSENVFIWLNITRLHEARCPSLASLSHACSAEELCTPEHHHGSNGRQNELDDGDERPRLGRVKVSALGILSAERSRAAVRDVVNLCT